MTESRLYYEAHITVAAGDDWELFRQNAEARGWRASKFDVDDVDAMHGQWFISNRNKTLEVIKSEVRFMVAFLGEVLEVLRWKIEDTVLDSKHGDALNG